MIKLAEHDRPKVIVAVKRDSAEPRVFGNATEGIDPYHSTNYFRKPKKMNERINKLAQPAGLAWAEDVGCGFPDIKYPPGYEKFAELIVKECAGICDQQGRSGWNDDRKAQARLDRDLIREHFGVE